MKQGYEYGSIKLSVCRYKSALGKVRKAYNDYRELQYRFALSVYEKLYRFSKGKRNFDWYKEVDAMLVWQRGKTFEEQVREQGTSDPKNWDERAHVKVPMNLDPGDWVWNSLFMKGENVLMKPRKPLKKDFEKASLSSVVFDLGPSSIVFTFGGIVSWRAESLVEKDALSQARKHPVAEALFNELGDIKRWAGKGGIIYRNDGEYPETTFGKG